MEVMRLCGGTFFTLALQARRQRASARDHIKSDSDGLSDSEMLHGLAQIMQPGIKMPVKAEGFRVSVTRYKSCQADVISYMPFGITQVINDFDFLVMNDYLKALERMNQFVEKFFDYDAPNSRCRWLVNALIELIEQDDSISNDQLLWVNANGTSINKDMLCKKDAIHFQPFLLGILHYAFCRVKNTVGKSTYNAWCPPKGKSRKRDFISDIGSSSTKDRQLIFVSCEEPTEEEKQIEKETIAINQDVEKVNELMLSLHGRLHLKPIKKPIEIVSKELKYVTPLYEAYGQHTNTPVKAKEDLSIRLQTDLELRRDDFYAAETVRVEGQNTLGACVSAEFTDTKEDIFQAIKNTWLQEYPNKSGEDDGYLRMLAVMAQAAVVPCEGIVLHQTGWIKPNVKQGICHMLTADGRITWVMPDE